MNFVNPAFLFALSAISIPIIIHLFNFRKFKRVYFPNVRFLKEVKQETQSKSRLKHLLVLVARILAVLFLVLAFAQPFVPAENTNVVAGEKVVSIYIDNSFSMEAINKNGTLLDEAKKRAEEIVSAFKATDKFQLLTNDFEGRHQRMVNKEEFLEMLQEVKISPALKTASEVTSRVLDLLHKETAAQKKMYFISDFQKTVTDLDKIKNDTSITCTLIPVIAEEKSNVYIDSCWFNSPVRQLGVNEQMNVRIRNVSSKTLENNPVKLFINGQQKTPASYNIQAESETSVILSFASKETGIQQCRIEINDFPVAFDDKFYFSFNVAKNIPVLCINSSEKLNDASNLSNESKALNKLFSDSLFVFSNVQESKLDYSLLSNNKLIILHGIKNISSGMAQELKRFVSKGGSLLVFPAVNTETGSYNTFFSSMNCSVYGNTDTVNTKVDKLNYEHPIYANVFEKKPDNIDLPAVLSHYVLSRGTRSNEEYLMRMQNGNTLLGKFDFEKGKVYLSAVPLDPEWSNFTRHALFVPTLYKIAVYSQGFLPLFYTIGEADAVDVGSASVTGENVFHIKGDASSSLTTNFDIIPEHKVGENGTSVFLHNQVKDAGNYSLHLGENKLTGLSFNYDRKESNLDCYTAKELLDEKDKAVLSNFVLIETGSGSLTDKLAEIDQGKKLWSLCVWLVLLFLGTEIMLLRFWKT